MKFANTTDNEVRFALRGREYVAAPRGEVTVPDALAYAVGARGLPLVPVDGQSGDVVDDDVSQQPEIAGWREQALQARAVAERLAGERKRAEEMHESLRAELASADQRYQAKITRLEADLQAVRARAERAEMERDEALEAATRGSAPADGSAAHRRRSGHG